MPYFFNSQTSQSTWDAPSELTQEQIRSLPGATEYLLGRPAQVRASHLLVKHRESRRPSSWKEVILRSSYRGCRILQNHTEQANITRSKEEAIQILEGFRAQINGSPEKFAQLAKEHSDCSSHAHDGDLGFFKPVCIDK